MIYGLNAHALSYDNDGDAVEEFENEQAAEAVALRDYMMSARERGQLRFDNLIQLHLFRTREEAEAANQTDDDEVQIDETKAFRTLEWECGFGYNF
jgi:hypothetical protein